MVQFHRLDESYCIVRATLVRGSMTTTATGRIHNTARTTFANVVVKMSLYPCTCSVYSAHVREKALLPLRKTMDEILGPRLFTFKYRYPMDATRHNEVESCLRTIRDKTAIIEQLAYELEASVALCTETCRRIYCTTCECHDTSSPASSSPPPSPPSSVLIIDDSNKRKHHDDPSPRPQSQSASQPPASAPLTAARNRVIKQTMNLIQSTEITPTLRRFCIINAIYGDESEGVRIALCAKDIEISKISSSRCRVCMVDAMANPSQVCRTPWQNLGE